MAQQLAAAFLSAIPVSPPFTFGNIHVGPGSYSKHEEGLGVGYEQTGHGSMWLGGTAIWRLRYRLLAPIPTGTPKIVMVMLTAGTGTAGLRVKWTCVSMGSDPSSVALSDEGRTDVVFSSGDENKYKETKVTLDAGTLTDAGVLVLDLAFIESEVGYSWTLTKTLTVLLPMIVSEI